jgi:hypothetical protein
MTGRHTRHRRPIARVLLAAGLLALLWMNTVHAQTPPAPAPLQCPGEVGTAHLYGQWQLHLHPPQGQPTAAPLRLERHPDYAETVRGQWTAATGTMHWLSGDLSDGELVLDESVDGVNIHAVWVGYPVDCGRGFEGERRLSPRDGALTDADNPALRQRFVLRRAGGWQ